MTWKLRCNCAEICRRRHSRARRNFRMRRSISSVMRPVSIRFSGALGTNGPSTVRAGVSK